MCKGRLGPLRWTIGASSFQRKFVTDDRFVDAGSFFFCRRNIVIHRSAQGWGFARFGKGHGAKRGRSAAVSKFQAEIPNPLRKNLPAFLSPGGMRTPTVRLLLPVFICQN